MNVFYRYKYFIPFCVVALLGLLTALCACSSAVSRDYFTVMVADGEGYSVTDNGVRNVKKGESVSFEIELNDGYEFIYASYGKYEDGILTVNNVEFSATIDFNVRPYESIINVVNGTAKITDEHGGVVVYGENADFYIIPKENYVVDEVYLNGVEYDFVREANGTVIINAMYDEFVSIQAACIGRECVVTTDLPGSALEATDATGGYLVLSGTADGITHYDDEISISCKPIEGYRFVYMTINNDKYYGIDELTSTVTCDMNISALFIDESYYAVIYDYNGGECLDSDPIDYSRFDENIYLKNGVDCWEKPDHVLTSWNTEPDGSGERHALGAMICMPNDDVVLYAQYKAVTDADLFEYAEFTGHDGAGYEIVAYKGKNIEEVVLPLEHDGKKVLSVGNGVFAEEPSIRSIVTNANIENIGDGAFSDMPNLSEILFFDSLRLMSDDALDGSDGLRKVRINSATVRIFDRILESNIVDKQMRVKTSTGKKIVTLSGCSLAKGMHSELFAENEVLKDYDVIHMGVHARYGLGFLTAMVENYLNAGDILVLSLEYYQHMWMTDRGLQQTNDDAYYRLRHLEANYDVYEEFDLVEQKYNNILPILPYYFYLRAYNLDHNNAVNPTPNRYDMNKYGDYTYFRPNAAQEFTSIESTLYPDMSFLDNMDRINEWVQAQKDKGVRVYFIFPPIWDRSLENEELNEDFLNALKEKANFPVLGSAQNAAFPFYCFDDWYNHMSTEGGYLYTAEFIELLSAAVASEGG